jgi:Zn-dependent protease with chaperone function
MQLYSAPGSASRSSRAEVTLRLVVRVFLFGFLPAAFVVLSFGAPISSVQSSAAPVIAQNSTDATAVSPPASTGLNGVPRRKIREYTLPPDLYRKARNRSRIRFASLLVGFFYTLFLLWLILHRKISAKFRDWAERVSQRRFLQALIFMPLLVLTIAILQLPFDLFDEGILKLYKISVQPWPSWAADWAKAQFLTIALGSFLAWLLYAMIRKSPARWWFYFWLLSLPIMLFIFFISPYVVEPMFYTFEPLSAKAPQLIAPLERVARRAGEEIPPERMFWMKASEKTIATNAYVSGFGSSKRIVIWDTAIAQETPDEVVADFGHEMGHYVLGHIWKGIAFFAAMIFFLLYFGYRSIGWLLARWGTQWGVRGLGDWASLPALLLLLTFYGFVASTLGNAFSRFQENQADIYGLEVTHSIVADPGQACAWSFQNFGEKVLVDPNPNPLQVFLFYDHPPVRDRIRLCVTYDPWSKGESPQFVK